MARKRVVKVEPFDIDGWRQEGDGLGYEHRSGAVIRRGPTDAKRWVIIVGKNAGQGYPLVSDAKLGAMGADPGAVIVK